MLKTSKITKILASMLIMSMLIISMQGIVSAAGAADIISTVKNGATIQDQGGMATIAGKIVGLIRTIAVIAGVILLSVLGVKYMLGSVEEKAEYKKSMMPLIIGIIVVMAATQITTMIFGFFTGT